MHILCTLKLMKILASVTDKDSEIYDGIILL